MSKATTFKPMRSCAPDFSKYPLDGLTFLMSRKLDGIRFVKFAGKALSKSMKPIANEHIRSWIEHNLPDGCDGEIISGPPNLGELTYNTTFRAVATHKGTPEFKLYLFDFCDSEAGTAEERLGILRSIVKHSSKIELVVNTKVNSKEQIDKLYKQYLDEGYEGAILKDPSGMYKYGRCTAKAMTQLKLKPEEDEDAEILGLYEAEHNGNDTFTNELGETTRSSHQENKTGNGMLGGFHARDCNTGVVFKVAAGKLTHEERRSIWLQWLITPGKFIGQFIKYRSMRYGVIEGGAPRHPRFYAWRAGFDV